MSDSTSPSLNPFPSDESSSNGSSWGIVIAAIILGIATAAGILFWRMDSIKSDQSTDAKANDKSEAAHTSNSQPENFINAAHSKIFSQTKNWDFFTRELENYVNELQKEREDLAAKSSDLAAAELRIKAEKEELVRIRKEIQSMREQLENLTTELTDVEKANLAAIAKTYSKMEPEKAVAIFSEMTENNSVKILALMKADDSAKILGQMATTLESPDSTTTLASKAASLTNRLRLYKKEDIE